MASEEASQSLVACYLDNAPVLRRRVERITHNKHTAEDILQEAVARGIKESERNPIRHPYAWLKRVSHNLAVDYFRKKKLSTLREHDDVREDSTSDDDVLPDARASDLEGIVMALPRTQSRVLTLHYWEGLTYEEIGGRLGISKGAASMHANRARRVLRRQLGRVRSVDYATSDERYVGDSS